jgi:hypothetical protein
MQKHETGLTPGQLGLWWPEVSRRLTAALTDRGVSRLDVADLLQETAARALAARPEVGSVDELSRWAFTVAWRLRIDGHRRSSRATIVPLDTARAGTVDVSHTVEGRLDWERTLEAMTSLSTLDRDALVSTLADSTAVDRRTAVRDAVRLHRARTRLIAMVGKLGAAAVAGWRGVRKLLSAVPAKVAVATALAVAVTLGLSTPVEPPAAEAQVEALPPARPQPPVPPPAPVDHAPAPQAHAAAAAPASAPPPPAAPAPPPPAGKKGGITGTVDDARPKPIFLRGTPVVNVPLGGLPRL